MKKTIKILLLFIVNFSFAQTLSSSLSKEKMNLGEVATYTIRIENVQGKTISIAPKGQLLPFHFEVVKDSILSNSNTYERIVEFQIFEEGTFPIPEIETKVGNQTLKTIAYQVQVTNPAQPQDEIHDIMGNKQVELTLADYWELYKWYVLAFLLALAILIVVFYLIKYGKKQRSEPVKNTNLTLKKLEALRKKKYIENQDFRAFYVELIDITREFLTRQYQIPADVLLTEDLVLFMKENNSISAENEAIVEPILLRGDQVKFAKIYPEPSVMQEDFNNLKKMVKNSIKDIEFDNLRKEV